ncbi:hypothetical protein ASC77_00515 [Nocardioides sp. Root1257]|uniref:hypothetical protein n=1 Tax=unclassified Nocardioides TaxID=2615069 RepID=UPI000700119D|nr:MULTISPECIES: hypothetical protein [unclassified Nocardioides]KQW52839.1 hypothetical protein ASC77_00515 [Nocardioides sp. Root1257]KRC55527.1 hypothetical protein ASE24_00515 [Nocardioides sp. Root224]
MTSRVLTAALTVGLTAALLGGSSTSISSSAAARQAVPRTHLTLQVTGCEGCEIGLTQALNGRRKVWQAKGRTVRNGSASWNIPTSRTHGLSITVLAPWDGGAGYVPTVAFRYAGERVGDEVTNATARGKRRASACWAGTGSDAVTLPITVVHAHSTNPPGDPIRTPRAFTSVTQRWETPMERAWHGISGTQDATYCG